MTTEQEGQAKANISDLFRSVNEHMRDAAEDLTVQGAERIRFFCECSRNICADMIVLTLDEYRRTRQQPDTFIMLPEHAMQDIETVVDEHPDYSVVKKHEPASRNKPR